MKYTIGLVTGVKNDVEILEHFIEHHLSLGIAKIHLMDFNSTDGSRDILRSYIDHPKVDVIFTDLNHGTPEIQQLLRLRALSDKDADFMFYIDADEFIVIPPKKSLDSVLGALPSNCYAIPRYNVVLPMNLQQGLNTRILQNLHKLYYFTPAAPTIDYPVQDVSKEWIRWLQQPIVQKVMHIKGSVHISLGGHFVYGPDISRYILPTEIFIAHFPVTTYSRMKQKLHDFSSLIQELPGLKKALFTRYIHLCYALETNKTEALYAEMFLPKEAVQVRMKMGLISSAQKLLAIPTKFAQGDVQHLGLFHELSAELAETKLANPPWEETST